MAIKAREEFLKIPESVPEIGRLVLRSLAFTAYLQINDGTAALTEELVQRMATDSRMGEVWEALKKYRVDPELFANAVTSAAEWPPYESDLMPPKEHSNWQDEVRSTAKKLAELVRGSRYNDILMAKTLKTQKSINLSGHRLYMAKMPDDEVVEPTNSDDLSILPLPYPEPFLLSVGLDHVLLEVASLNETEVVPFKTKTQQQKPNNNPYAFHHHFSHQLKEFFLEECGRKLWAAVAKTAQVFFDDENIDIDSVRKWKPSPSVNSESN